VQTYTLVARSLRPHALVAREAQRAQTSVLHLMLRGSQLAQTRLLFSHAVRDGDTGTVRTLLSSAEAQSFINYQDAVGATPVFIAAQTCVRPS
jgi:hypothetical protein